MKKVLAVVMAAVCTVMVTGCGDQGDYDTLSEKHALLIEQYDDLQARYNELEEKNDDLTNQIEELKEENTESFIDSAGDQIKNVPLDAICMLFGENSSYTILDKIVIFNSPLSEEPTVENVATFQNKVYEHLSDLTIMRSITEKEIFYFRCTAMNNDLVCEIKADYSGEKMDMSFSYGLEYSDVVEKALAKLSASK